MKYILDTNICIYIIKNKPEIVLKKLNEHNIEDVCISSITYAELIFGVEKSNYQDRHKLALLVLLSRIKVMDFDTYAANEYGKIRANLEKIGTLIDNMDMLIAAHAKALNLTLVTNNTKEFNRVTNLKIENWAI